MELSWYAASTEQAPYVSKRLYYNCVGGFTNNGDGTVIDSNTGLIWQKCSYGQTDVTGCTDGAVTRTWTAALSYCEALTLGGKTWRLPNINELRSIVDVGIYNPLINPAFFPNTTPFYYHSSSSYVANASSAWAVGFHVGDVGYGSKTYNLYVRCVSGP